jgi:hypothetical protein
MWDTALHPMPSGDYDGGTVKPGFDPGATTSGYSGLEYLSAIGKIDNNCIGVTAHAMADIPAMDGGGYTCVNDPHDMNAIWDAPSSSYDIGGTSLWEAADLPASGVSVFRSNQHPDNHCATVLQARIDINLDFSTEKIQQVSASSFPNIVAPLNNTSGDYDIDPSLSLPGGGFLVIWAAPISTSSSAGTPYQGNHYNLRVRGRALGPQ